MNKLEAHAIILDCAKMYQTNLAGYNIVFVFQDTPGKVSALTTAFYPGNYLHLTGAKLSGKIKMSASEFFDACINNQLRVSDWNFAEDGTTQLKLAVLPYLMQPHLSAKMLGGFNGRNLKLYTDKVVGSQNKGCMGFVMDGSEIYYAPNTVLNVDMRDITEAPQKRILVTLRKRIAESSYQEIVYKAKGVDLSKLSILTKLGVPLP